MFFKRKIATKYPPLSSLLNFPSSHHPCCYHDSLGWAYNSVTRRKVKKNSLLFTNAITWFVIKVKVLNLSYTL